MTACKIILKVQARQDSSMEWGGGHKRENWGSFGFFYGGPPVVPYTQEYFSGTN